MGDPMITVKITSQYGNERIMPVSVEAHTFCDIAGTKTLTRANIDRIKALGYKVVIEPDKPATL